MNMKKLGLAAAVLAACLGVAVNAHAGDQDFTIVNKTGMALGAMYVAPDSSKSWGKDLFRGKVLASGREVEITFSEGNEHCNYSINFTDSKGNEYEINGVDLCSVTQLKLTKDGDSIAYEAIK
jgi:hypothetical protein